MLKTIISVSFKAPLWLSSASQPSRATNTSLDSLKPPKMIVSTSASALRSTQVGVTSISFSQCPHARKLPIFVSMLHTHLRKKTTKSKTRTARLWCPRLSVSRSLPEVGPYFFPLLSLFFHFSFQFFILFSSSGIHISCTSHVPTHSHHITIFVIQPLCLIQTHYSRSKSTLISPVDNLFCSHALTLTWCTTGPLASVSQMLASWADVKKLATHASYADTQGLRYSRLDISTLFGSGNDERHLVSWVKVVWPFTPHPPPPLTRCFYSKSLWISPWCQRV